MTAFGRTVAGEDDRDDARVRRANRRLAIALGVIAFGFYLGMLLLRPH